LQHYIDGVLSHEVHLLDQYKVLVRTRYSSGNSLFNIQSASHSAPDTPTPPAARRILDIKIGSMLLLPSRRVKAILKDNGVLSVLAEGV
jgi:hypothetical protein